MAPTTRKGARSGSTGSISAPVWVSLSGRNPASWRCRGTHSEAGTLEGLEGGPREGEDAEALLLEATGWDIPVNALSRWVRGLQAEGLPVELRSFSTGGYLQTLRQGGWHIDYTQWAGVEGVQAALPSRIEARRDQATVKLIVDRWDFTAP